MHVEPAWYVDALLDGLQADAIAGSGDPAQDVAVAPDTLAEWR